MHVTATLAAVIGLGYALGRILGRVGQPLLPAFFAYTGMRMQITLLRGWDSWLCCGAIILTASVGKIGGTFIAGRLTGMGWRDAAALGT